MKTIAEIKRSLNLRYFDELKFDAFAKQQESVTIKKGLGGGKVEDSDVEKLLEAWRDYLEEEQLLKDEENRLAEVARDLPITSGHGFDGYKITYYGGYVSGDEAIKLTDAWLGQDFNKDRINDAIKEIRIIAIEELKAAAAEVGCNAVIGLDFDYVTIDRQFRGLSGAPVNETYLILTANGTAVTIEEIDD